jgi:hypothetical protein
VQRQRPHPCLFIVGHKCLFALAAFGFLCCIPKPMAFFVQKTLRFHLAPFSYAIAVRGGAKKRPTCLHLRRANVHGCWPTPACSISRLRNITWVRGPLGLFFALKTKRSTLRANDCQSRLVVSFRHDHRVRRR